MAYHEAKATLKKVEWCHKPCVYVILSCPRFDVCYFFSLSQQEHNEDKRLSSEGPVGLPGMTKHGHKSKKDKKEDKHSAEEVGFRRESNGLVRRRKDGDSISIYPAQCKTGAFLLCMTQGDDGSLVSFVAPVVGDHVTLMLRSKSLTNVDGVVTSADLENHIYNVKTEDGREVSARLDGGEVVRGEEWGRTRGAQRASGS